MPESAELIIHPAALVLPELTTEEFEDLKGSIEKHGQRFPILVIDGQIVDGRSRYKACQALGIKAKIEYADGEEPYTLSEISNLHKRPSSTILRHDWLSLRVSLKLIPKLLIGK